MSSRSFELSSLEVLLPGADFRSGTAGSVRRASHVVPRAGRSNLLSAHGRATTMRGVAAVKARSACRGTRIDRCRHEAAVPRYHRMHPQPILRNSTDPLTFGARRSPFDVVSRD